MTNPPMPHHLPGCQGSDFTCLELWNDKCEVDKAPAQMVFVALIGALMFWAIVGLVGLVL